jgi:hypothetical protein
MAADASDEEMAILMPAEQGDMVRRLRDYMRHTCNGITCKLCDDAATRIEALEAALRDAIEELEHSGLYPDHPSIERVRKALAP